MLILFAEVVLSTGKLSITKSGMASKKIYFENSNHEGQSRSFMNFLSIKSSIVRKNYFFHLALVIALKILFLIALWHVFIKPNKVHVDSEVMSNRIISAENSKEQTHD